MLRRALALPFSLALALAVAAPALAQTAASPSTPGTTPRALPGTGGTDAVPDNGGGTGSNRGPTNDPNAGRSGAGDRIPFSTAPMQGGGPLGQHTAPPSR